VFLAGKSPNIWCIYTVLANPTYNASTQPYLQYTERPRAWATPPPTHTHTQIHTRTHTYTHAHTHTHAYTHTHRRVYSGSSAAPNEDLSGGDDCHRPPYKSNSAAVRGRSDSGAPPPCSSPPLYNQHGQTPAVQMQYPGSNPHQLAHTREFASPFQGACVCVCVYACLSRVHMRTRLCACVCLCVKPCQCNAFSARQLQPTPETAHQLCVSSPG